MPPLTTDLDFSQAMSDVAPGIQTLLPTKENTKRSLHHQGRTPPVPRVHPSI